ncbi:MAG: AMP-binding protein [Vicinamibacteria bacterium]
MSSVFLEHFARVARDRPHDVMLWAPQEGLEWRAGDLLALADDIRRRLLATGIERGQAVLSTLGNHSAFVGLAMACLDAGWPLLPADRQTSLHDIRALAAQWRPAAVVAAIAVASSPRSTAPRRTCLSRRAPSPSASLPPARPGATATRPS